MPQTVCSCHKQVIGKHLYKVFFMLGIGIDTLDYGGREGPYTTISRYKSVMEMELRNRGNGSRNVQWK
jgi:hypothetical protein